MAKTETCKGVVVHGGAFIPSLYSHCPGCTSATEKLGELNNENRTLRGCWNISTDHVLQLKTDVKKATARIAELERAFSIVIKVEKNQLL